MSADLERRARLAEAISAVLDPMLISDVGLTIQADHEEAPDKENPGWKAARPTGRGTVVIVARYELPGSDNEKRCAMPSRKGAA